MQCINEKGSLNGKVLEQYESKSDGLPELGFQTLVKNPRREKRGG